MAVFIVVVAWFVLPSIIRYGSVHPQPIKYLKNKDVTVTNYSPLSFESCILKCFQGHTWGGGGVTDQFS